MRHNPDNLTDEQIETEKGWRLLNENELGKEYCDIQVWDVNYHWVYGGTGSSKSLTYRIRALPIYPPTAPCHPEPKRPDTKIFLPTWLLSIIAFGILAPIFLLVYLILTR